MATSQLKVGTLLHKQHVYASSETWFRAAGRGLIAAKGGSRQRKYLCDQQNQGCKARVQWVKQATDEWKVSRLDGEHENCGGATTSATIRGAQDVLENIVRADSSIFGPKLKKL